MPRKRLKTLRISDPRQLRAIRTPFRQELLESVARLGPSSVKELAGALNRSPASLYYHLHALEKAGLVASKKWGAGEGRTDTTYEAVADRIMVDRTVRSPAFARALVDLHRAALNQADREIEDALGKERIEGTKEGDAVMLLRLTSCLSSTDAREARRRLRDLARFLSDHAEEGGDETLSLTAALVKTS